MKVVPHHKLFLNDAMGALLTACIHGFILSRLTELTGIPKQPLIILSLVALSYALYSVTCYFLKPKNWRFFLRIIAAANICFCLATTALMIYYHAEISFIAIVFFIAEILLILIIASMEFMSANA